MKRQRSGDLCSESVDKVAPLLDGDAARSKIRDFRTVLYPRQYHPCVLENRKILRFSPTRCFFDALVAEKTKMRLNAANYKNLSLSTV